MNRLNYQKMNDRDTKCLTPGVDMDEYRIVSYMGGEQAVKATNLTYRHFDFTSLITSSQHPIKGIKVYHFTGSRDEVITIFNAVKIK